MSLKDDIVQHLSIWLAVAALVIGLSSVTADYMINHANQHNGKVALCRAEEKANQAQRDFYAGLLASPKTPTAIRQQVVAAALKSFPVIPADCVVG